MATKQSQTPAQIAQNLLQAEKSTAIDARMDHFSEKFLGAPFDDYPLGEGDHGEYDKEPLFRFDRFDCMTFIETVIALAVSKSEPQFEKNLRHIRYQGGRVSFVSRNHFPCVDWIPHNTQNGVLRDVTEQVAGTIPIKWAMTNVDKKNWYAQLPAEELRLPNATEEERKKLLVKLHGEGNHMKIERGRLPYLPIEALVIPASLSKQEQEKRAEEEKVLGEEFGGQKEKLHDALVDERSKHVIHESEVDEKILARIPNGTILNIIRPNWIVGGTPMSVSHQGLVFQGKDGAYLRHVSRSGGRRVKNVRLGTYLKLCLLSPSIHGINLLWVVAAPH